MSGWLSPRDALAPPGVVGADKSFGGGSQGGAAGSRTLQQSTSVPPLHAPAAAGQKFRARKCSIVEEDEEDLDEEDEVVHFEQRHFVFVAFVAAGAMNKEHTAGQS